MSWDGYGDYNTDDISDDTTYVLDIRPIESLKSSSAGKFSNTASKNNVDVKKAETVNNTKSNNNNHNTNANSKPKAPASNGRPTSRPVSGFLFPSKPASPNNKAAANNTNNNNSTNLKNGRKGSTPKKENTNQTPVTNNANKTAKTAPRGASNRSTSQNKTGQRSRENSTSNTAVRPPSSRPRVAPLATYRPTSAPRKASNERPQQPRRPSGPTKASPKKNAHNISNSASTNSPTVVESNTPNHRGITDVASPMKGGEDSLENTIRREREIPLKTYNRAIVAENGGNRFLNDYLLFQDVGRGASAKVLMGYSMSRNNKVAIKVIQKPKEKKYQLAQSESVLASLRNIEKEQNGDDAAIGYNGKVRSEAARKLQALQKEIEVMSRIHHEHIVSLYEVIDDPHNNKLFLILQYVDDGPVASIDNNGKLSRSFKSAELLPIAVQISSALHFVHRQHIVHRDIKPENILLSTKNEAFLADFGVAEIIEDGSPTPTIENCGYQGTPLFMPPELYARREDLEALGPPAEIEKRKMVNVYALDVWSLGITFLSLLTGEIPFHSLNQIRSVLTKGFQLPSSVPAEWVPVLSAMTHPNQHRRADMRTVRKMLKEMEEKQIKSVRAIPSTKSIPTKNLDIKFSTIKMTNEDDAVLTSMLGTMYNNDEMHPKRNVENSFVTFGKEMGEDSVRCSYSNVHQKGRAADTGSGGNSAVRGGPVLVRQASTGTPLLPNVRTPATIGGKLNPWHNPSISQSQISLESNDFDGRNRRAQALMDAVKLKLT